MSFFYNVELGRYSTDPPVPADEWIKAKLYIIYCHTEPPVEPTGEMKIAGDDFWDALKSYTDDDYLVSCFAWQSARAISDPSHYSMFPPLASENCPVLQHITEFDSTRPDYYYIRFTSKPDIVFGGSRSSTGSGRYVPMTAIKIDPYTEFGFADGLPRNLSAITLRGKQVDYMFLLANKETIDIDTKLWIVRVRISSDGSINRADIYGEISGNPPSEDYTLKKFLSNLPPDGEINPPSTDPYAPGGTTESGGGNGTFDEKSDPVEIPNLPALSASDTGLVTLFNPTLSQLKQLSAYLWSDLFDVTAWKKIFADPMDAILGLSIVPVSVPNTGASPIKVGNIATDVSANKATSQFVEVDCGSVDVTEYWGAYLDYDPYTKVELYLPYIGVHPLTTDDVMGKSVRVVYHVDVLSGACCAYVKCGSSVLYSFVGQCSCSIPITGSDWTNVINGAINIAASIGSMVATGGATAPMAVADIASTAVNSMKPTVEKSGSISGTGGLMGLQTPYLILTRPRQAVPENQNRYSGYPSFITRKLGDLTGYTEIESIHLENIPATEHELTEIESLLKGGVLL